MSRSAAGRAAGYVLAGGASRRMGRDKALLEKDGSPLLARVAGVVAAVAGQCTAVAPGGRYDGLGVPILADRWPGEGPLGGIVTALEDTGAEWNLIVAVDMPFIDANFLQMLLDEAMRGAETVVPAQPDGELEPLCGVYHAGAAGPLRRYFDGGGRRLKDALRQIPLRTVAAPKGLLESVNTPEQWEAARV